MTEIGELDKRNEIQGRAMRRVLFLGYGPSETRLIDEISNLGLEVVHSDQPMRSFSNFDLVISFGYRHIISSELINSSQCPLINLHISMLPWNRGAHPIYWAFFDNTPLGVTVHEIDSGLDTGPIVAQREVVLELVSSTFKDVHSRMIREVETLLMDCFDEIVLGIYESRPQFGVGSFHKAVDLPTEFSGWGSVISDEIKRLKGLTKIS